MMLRLILNKIPNKKTPTLCGVGAKKTPIEWEQMAPRLGRTSGKRNA
jgi:hypothetical protein